MLTFRWLGVAGIELERDGRILAIDPFFTRPPFHSLWIGRIQPDQALIEKNIREYDFILISHAHYDHLMDVPVVLRKTGALALGSGNTCQLLKLLGAADPQIRKIEAGDRATLGLFQIEVLSSQHHWIPGFGAGPLKDNLVPPLRLRDYRMDCSFSFLILADGLRVLVWTSPLARQAPQADVLFLSLSGGRNYLETLLSEVQPGVVIPTHWDDFFQPFSKPIRPSFDLPRFSFPPIRRKNLDEFRHIVRELAPGVKVIVPEIFHPYRLTGEGREAYGG